MKKQKLKVQGGITVFTPPPMEYLIVQAPEGMVISDYGHFVDGIHVSFTSKTKKKRKE